MKRHRQGFRFLGFVALADALFAVSAGLLLLNPIRFESKPAVTPPPAPEALPQPQELRPMIVEIQKLELRLDRLEKDGRLIRARALEVLKNE
jgi:hypothetical protein